MSSEKKAVVLNMCYKRCNYGGTLQSFALWKIVNNIGIKCDIALYDWESDVNPVYSSDFEKASQYKVSDIIKKIFEKLESSLSPLIRNELDGRRRQFEDFLQCYATTTAPCTGQTIKEMLQGYHYLIVGSDQIWNPNSVRLPYLLEFASEEQRKIAYAASIGRVSLSPHENEIMLPYIERFDSISVREQTAYEILNEVIKHQIQVVLDPVALMNWTEWDEFAVTSPFKKPYLLTYFFSDKKENWEAAQFFAQKYGLDVLNIPYPDMRFRKSDYKDKGHQAKNVGPREFIGLIKNASIVFTDSFHGLLFSIIYEKEFYVIKRHKAGVASQNSRIEDLLRKYKLEYRIVSPGSHMDDKFCEPISYKKISSKIQEERESAFRYLRNSCKE